MIAQQPPDLYRLSLAAAQLRADAIEAAHEAGHAWRRRRGLIRATDRAATLAEDYRAAYDALQEALADA